MCFEQLYESSKRDELILIDGGMCHYHLRRDRQLTIKEIISQRPGAGQEMLQQLIAKRPRCILAKCPADLDSNSWYTKQGFCLERVETAKSGRAINVWILWIVGRFGQSREPQPPRLPIVMVT